MRSLTSPSPLSLVVALCVWGWLILVAVADNNLSPPYNHFYEFPLPIPPVKTPLATINKPNGLPLDYYEIKILNFTQQVYPELGATHLVGYDGISPGPTFHMTKGREAVVRFINVGNDKASVIHLHGSFTHPPWDGWAEDIIPVGSYKDYYYPNGQVARTLWYHDHAIDHTAENAYFGQAGFYILTDGVEPTQGLPMGKYDVPLALSSKQYQANGELVSPAGNVESLFGDVIHVNGQPWPFLQVEPRKYRFRFLNTAISRTFRLYFTTSLSITEQDTANHIRFFVVGSDSGRTAKPVQTPDLWISMAERWEVVFDFAPFAGKEIFLKNFFETQADTPFTNTNQVMKFKVGTTVTDPSNNAPLPGAFNPLPLPPGKSLSNPDHVFNFERQGDEWKINGVTFDDVNNRVLARPPRGTVELWRLENHGGGWSHPIHIHLIDFQVVARQQGKRPVLPYEAASLQDVVLLGENEVVFVLARYSPWDGLYMFHCHNLVHEDHAMMGAFNSTVLAGFSSLSNKAEFIDPMEARFRAAPYNPAAQNQQLSFITGTTLPGFAALGAYDNVAQLEGDLAAFLATKRPVQTDTAPVSSEFRPAHGRVRAEPTPAPVPMYAG